MMATTVPRTSAGAQVSVPDVTGMPGTEANRLLHAYGLELRVEGALSLEEFRSRSEGLRARIRAAEERLRTAGETKSGADPGEWREKAEAVLRRALAAAPSLRTELAAAVLERAVVGKESTKRRLVLEITLKTGETCRVLCRRDGSPPELLP